MAEGVFVRELAPEEGRKLLTIIRRGSGSVARWRRAQIVLWSAQRMSVAQIAEIAFTSEDRVREVIHNYNADGFDSLAPKYGKVCLAADVATTHLIADINGHFPTGSEFMSLSPVRVLDSREGGATVDGLAVGGGRPPVGATVELQVAGRAGVPGDASAVVLNVTATDTTGWGFVTVWPCGEQRPNASSLNYTDVGQTTPNAVIARVGSDGKVCLAADVATTHLIADINGYLPGP